MLYELLAMVAQQFQGYIFRLSESQVGGRVFRNGAQPCCLLLPLLCEAWSAGAAHW